MSIRVTIFEDSESLRISLFHVINESPGFTCVGAHEDCLDLMKDVEKDKPNVVIMDIQMPGINGIEAVSMLREKYPDLKIMMQTIFEDEEKIFASILAGASGYILKNTSPARIIEFIKETYEGGAPMSPSVAKKVLKMLANQSTTTSPQVFDLTEREREVLLCLVEGMSYKMIGKNCTMSLDTVRTHIRNIYEKLHVHSKSEAVAKAIKSKIV